MDRFWKRHSQSQQQLIKTPKESLFKILEDDIQFLKKHYSPNSIPTIFAVYEWFFSTVHDRTEVNWKKLKKMFPEMKKKEGNDTWTDQDIREMLKIARHRRNRALIYFFCMGSRIGAIPDLKKRHIKKMQNGCISVLIYEGEKDEQTIFLTPEASKSLEAYLRQRKILEAESPLFATLDESKAMSLDLLHGVLLRIIRDIPGNTRTKNGGHRFTVPVAHGFRKWFATKIKARADISWSMGERLLGHKSGMDVNYFMPKEKLFENFCKAIPDLTLDDHKKQEAEIRHLKSDNEAIKQLKDEFKNYKKIVKALVSGVRDPSIEHLVE